MRFRDFVEMSDLMNLLNVPQRPDFHAEGPVKTHTRMVRAKLDEAIKIFQTAASDPNSSLSSVSPQISEQERNILRLAAWLHDIGKGPATMSKTPTGDVHWTKAGNYDPLSLRSIDHERGVYFNQAARELLQSPIWKGIYDSASNADKKDLWFIIRNHMSLHDMFSKRILGNMIDENGKYKNTRRVKLLIIFILMDRLGRIDGGATGGQKDVESTLKALEAGAKKRLRIKQSQPAPDDEAEFVKAIAPRLSGKPLNQQIAILKGAMAGKFNRPFSDQEISTFLQDLL